MSGPSAIRRTWHALLLKVAGAALWVGVALCALVEDDMEDFDG